MKRYKIHHFPKTRLATMDVCEIGKQKHHIAAFVEFDISGSREKIRKHNKENHPVSFTAWLLKVISVTVKEYEQVAAFINGRQSLIVFNDINISMVVEKELNGQKIPIPLVIEKANEKSIQSITQQISEARNEKLTKSDIVLKKKSATLERIYFSLPGFIRRLIWRRILKNPRFAFSKMGNVAVTSIGMMGKVNGWFIPASVHPICFGISTITKKPVVINDKIEIREIMNMTILLDHDVIDGANMARFISALSKNIENGIGL
jgi:pyruvate/2-oxoglutarate dehydrogenase complex dihydrolipoamide acyltransferase (E2) component